MHEWGHWVLHLNDQYLLDYKPDEENLPTPLRDIPQVWRSYNLGNRNDELGRCLMYSVDPWIGKYSAEQLARRVKEGWVHDFERIMRDLKGWPGEVPSATYLDFGSRFKGAKVEVYRTHPTGKNKALGEEPIFQGEVDQEGKVNIGNPFKDWAPHPNEGPWMKGYIQSPCGVLFIKVITPEGKVYFRWEDIRAFNLAYWRGYKEVVMKMNLASAETDPLSFDWTIEYSFPKPSSNLPSSLPREEKPPSPTPPPIP